MKSYDISKHNNNTYYWNINAYWWNSNKEEMVNANFQYSFDYRIRVNCYAFLNGTVAHSLTCNIYNLYNGQNGLVSGQVHFSPYNKIMYFISIQYSFSGVNLIFLVILLIHFDYGSIENIGN